MITRAGWLILLITLSSFSLAYSQQDLDFHINQHLLQGKQILKVRRDYNDPYLWVLAANNEVYRINSETFAIDNYTAAFSSFSNLKFIDIAGYSADTVYVASNSPEVIEYEKGALKTIGPAQNLNNIVTSIGISNISYNIGKLLIGTTASIYIYDIKGESLEVGSTWNGIHWGNAYVFATTYRNAIFTDTNDANLPAADYIADIETGYSGYQEIISPLTSSINTAYYTLASPYYYGSTFDGNIFWGTKYGLFQCGTDLIPLFTNPYSQYLNGINVNKIVDVLGLYNFYDPQNSKQINKDNLLVGTDQGLYFSNSLYDHPNYYGAVFSLFHFDALGNITINDICVSPALYNNAANTTCENSVWLATPDGAYDIVPDYTKYLNPNLQLAKEVYFNIAGGDTIRNVNLCAGSSLQLLYNIYDRYDNTIQWQKNGGDIPGQNGASLMVTDSGDYNVIVHNPCENISLSTNHIRVNLVSGPVFTFNYPDTLRYCDSTTATFRVTNSPSYHYRWYYNDELMDGDSTASITISQNGKYKVEVSACTNSWVPSKEVQVYLLPVPDPGFSINKVPYCQGDTARMQSSTFLDTTQYTMQWYRNDTLLTNLKNQLVIYEVKTGDYTLSYTDNHTGCSKMSPVFHFTYLPAPVFTFNYPDKLQYCDSASTTLRVSSDIAYGYRWYKDGQLNGNTLATQTVTQSGKYKVEVSSCGNSWVSSKEVEVDLVSLPSPVINPDKSVYCSGDNATLKLNIPADPSYTINWYKDGSLIAAAKDLTSITATINGAYTAVLTSNVANCSKSSAVFQLTFTSAPTFTFNYPDELNYCANTPVTLSVQGNPGYQYRWYKDGVLNGNTLTTQNITQSGKYKVEVSACPNSWVPSKEVQVNFIQVPVPVITPDKPGYCIGDNATLSLSVSPDPYYTINWYKDNVLLPAYINQSAITTGIAGNYTVAVTGAAATTDGSLCSQPSNVVPVSFDTPPTVSIEQIPYSTFCQGLAISLKADHTGGSLKWSTGETTDRIDVTNTGTYTVTLTSAAGCTAIATTNVTFFANPVLNVNDTTICTYKHQMVTLTAPAGYVKYFWNAVPGGQTYTVTTPQTVNLTIYDANGCETSRQIHVTEQCLDVFIPNTFTPNGDGINDVWDIQGLDASALIKIFNRYGSMLYQSKGYPIPWDGSYKGKKLLPATYYYIITAKNGAQTFSGAVTILY